MLYLAVIERGNNKLLTSEVDGALELSEQTEICLNVRHEIGRRPHCLLGSEGMVAHSCPTAAGRLLRPSLGQFDTRP